MTGSLPLLPFVLVPAAATDMGGSVAAFRPPGHAVQHLAAGAVFAAVARELRPEIKQDDDVQTLILELAAGAGVDLLDTFFFMREDFEHMRPGGATVNVSGIHAVEPSPLITPYAAAEAALVSLTRSAAPEGMARGLRVNAVRDPAPSRHRCCVRTRT